MRYSVLYERLQNLIKYKPSQKELGDILGLAQTAISGRAQRNSNFDDEQVEKIEKHYKISLLPGNEKCDILPFPTGDKIDITYWSELPEDLKNPKIASVWFDREIIENAWGISAEHLCIMPMIGDKMTNYWYPIRSNDILIVDTSHNYIMGNGVYFATSRNNTRLWIREMQILLDQTLEINGFAPSGNTRKVFTNPELQQADFKVIGKVLKNVSFRL